MLLLATPGKLAECDVRSLVSLAMPFKMQDLLDTLGMMMAQHNRWNKRHKGRPGVMSENDRRAMERNGIDNDEGISYFGRRDRIRGEEYW